MRFCENRVAALAGKVDVTQRGPCRELRATGAKWVSMVCPQTIAPPFSSLPLAKNPPALAERRTRLVIIVTPIGFLGIIKQTFLFRNLTATNYARLKVSHHVVDLLRA